MDNHGLEALERDELVEDEDVLLLLLEDINDKEDDELLELNDVDENDRDAEVDIGTHCWLLATHMLPPAHVGVPSVSA